MVILIQCSDRVGLVADIAAVLAERKLNIVAMREYVDTAANYFFARIVTEQHNGEAELQKKLSSILPADSSVRINPESEKKIIVLVTKEHHCLSDLLVRNHFKTLGATIQCVIGNHEVLKGICDRFEVPFYHVSHENKTKEQFELEIRQAVGAYKYDYLVLAKFMRILSPDFISNFPMEIVNIHHSFLPAFVGANPYRQAHARGVKLIGATAHFVTNELDQGPIIEQEIVHVNHTYTPADMVRAGMEVEKSVLARALAAVLQDRVFVYNNKTVVFE
jgi:formyltetrahydrofolate deformylase